MDGWEPASVGDAFVDLVRDALLHLHDASRLQMHPLAQRVTAQTGHDVVLRGKLLVRDLLDTIRILRPGAGTPSDSLAWRAHRILELRYIEGLSARQVMEELALSKTQYHRDHGRALEAVASALRERWGLVGPPAIATAPQSRESLVLRETEQLVVQMSLEQHNLVALLDDLIGLFRQPIVESRTRLSLRVSPDVSAVYGDRVALRQIFVILLESALGRSAGGAIDIALQVRGDAVEISVTASAPTERSATTVESALDQEPEWKFAQRLVETLGGSLNIEPPIDVRSWQAIVTLPVARRPLVLILDNHPDFINLVSRYLVEQGWQIIATHEAGEAQAMAADFQPNVILLDVIMPGRDGWDLLLALKSTADTRHIPVVICSVLHEPKIARALGADGYLPKPVSPKTLLEALTPFRGDRRGPVQSR